MADEKKTEGHEFMWNKDSSFFTKQQQSSEEQQITLGPDLSWPLMNRPESANELSQHREKIRSISQVPKAA